jgi:hypothetical protein
MNYAIFSSDGNLLESFDERGAARAALQHMVTSEPEAMDEIAIVVLGDDGAPTGEAMLPVDPDRAPSVVDDPRGTNVQDSQASAARRGSAHDLTEFHGWMAFGANAHLETWGKCTHGPEPLDVTFRETA